MSIVMALCWSIVDIMSTCAFVVEEGAGTEIPKNSTHSASTATNSAANWTHSKSSLSLASFVEIASVITVLPNAARYSKSSSPPSRAFLVKTQSALNSSIPTMDGIVRKHEKRKTLQRFWHVPLSLNDAKTDYVVLYVTPIKCGPRSSTSSPDHGYVRMTTIIMQLMQPGRRTEFAKKQNTANKPNIARKMIPYPNSPTLGESHPMHTSLEPTKHSLERNCMLKNSFAVFCASPRVCIVNPLLQLFPIVNCFPHTCPPSQIRFHPQTLPRFPNKV